MEILICLIVGTLITSVIFIYFKLDKTKKRDEEQNNSILPVNESVDYFPIIEIIEDNSILPFEKNKIIDSELKNAIIKIDTFTPNSVMSVKNIKNGRELLNKEKAFFSATKKGTENMIYVKNSNKVYGTQAVKGKFSKNTQFAKEKNLVSASGKNAILSSGFNVASMVVGQYYMNEINNKLDDLKNNIQDISDYLDSEYKSKLIQIVSKMQEIFENKSEILSNDYSRDKRYDEVLNLEETCTNLLGQANEMIKTNLVAEELSYKKYESKILTIHKWFVRQQFLQALLLEIGNMRNILANGNESSTLSYTPYNNYLKQTNNINKELEDWNKRIGEKIGIDTLKSRRKGNLFEIRKNTIGKINEEFAYDKLGTDIISIIKKHSNIKKLNAYTNNKQEETIRIQKYNGEYYNLIDSN